MYTTYIYELNKSTNLIHISKGADMMGECQVIAMRAFEKFLNEGIRASDMKFFISRKLLIGTYGLSDAVLINDQGEPEMVFTMRDNIKEDVL